MNTSNITRRHFFQDCAVGTGKIALASLLAESAYGAAKSPNVAASSHFQPKAKAVIHMFMAGAPSQLEMFDYKPTLTKYEGKPLPPSIIGGQRYAFIRPDAACWDHGFKFAKHGRCGAELSEVLPHLATIVDDIAIVKSCRTTQFNHAPAQIFMNTGFSQPGRPSMGSWITYGLGAETRDLPELCRQGAPAAASAAARRAGAAVSCRSVYAGGDASGNTGDPILNVSTPEGIDEGTQKNTIDSINSMNQRRLKLDGDGEIATRIANYEMAYRLQTSAPELMDLSKEDKNTLEMYGCDPKVLSFARACPLRGAWSSGARFINIYNEVGTRTAMWKAM
ncbi:MAG: DUF1501 domain-containing protein [Prosthecobacter sp.]